MIGSLIKMLISRRMSAEMGKIAASIKVTDPGLEGEFKKVQQDIKQLEDNMSWYCKAYPDSPMCKGRVNITYKKEIRK